MRTLYTIHEGAYSSERIEAIFDDESEAIAALAWYVANPAGYEMWAGDEPEANARRLVTYGPRVVAHVLSDDAAEWIEMTLRERTAYEARLAEIRADNQKLREARGES